MGAGSFIGIADHRDKDTKHGGELINGIFYPAATLYDSLGNKLNYTLTKDGTFGMDVVIKEAGNITRFRKFGRNPEVDTANKEEVWDKGNGHVFPTAGGQVSLNSTSINDAAGGTGLRTARMFYLDTGFVDKTEDVALNGTTNVLTVATDIFRVNSVQGLTAGSTGENEGDIEFTHSGNPIAFITAGANKTQQAIFTVPDGFTECKLIWAFMLLGYSASSVGVKSGAFEIRVREEGGLFVNEGVFPINNRGDGEVLYNPKTAIDTPPHTDIKFVFEAFDNNCLVTTFFDLECKI